MLGTPPNGSYYRLDGNGNIDDGATPHTTIPEFFVREVEVKDDAGEVVSRFPREMVRFRTAGDNLTVPESYVTARIKQEYALFYHQWKNQTGEGGFGTPIDNWPMVSVDQARLLKTINIFTVEALASVADVHISGLMGGPMLKRQAQDFVSNRKTQAEAESLKSREAEATKLANMAFAQMNDMADKMKAMQEQLAALQGGQEIDEGDAEAPPRRGPGRPRNNPDPQPAAA